MLELHDFDRAGLRAFLPILRLVLDTLALGKGLEGRPLHNRMVKEDLISAITGDEPESAVTDQLLDGSLRHTLLPQKKQKLPTRSRLHASAKGKRGDKGVEQIYRTRRQADSRWSLRERRSFWGKYANNQGSSSSFTPFVEVYLISERLDSANVAESLI